MLAVRAELHLEVAVLGVEEEGLHHLVVELLTKVPKVYAKFYHHGEGPSPG